LRTKSQNGRLKRKPVSKKRLNCRVLNSFITLSTAIPVSGQYTVRRTQYDRLSQLLLSLLIIFLLFTMTYRCTVCEMPSDDN